MKNFFNSLVLVSVAPVLLVMFSNTKIIGNDVSRTPAVEKTYKPLKAQIYKYLVTNAR